MKAKRTLPMLYVAALVASLAPGLLPGVAAADAPAQAAPQAAPPVPPAVLAGLARHAESFEQMKLRGGYTLDGKVEELDSDGKASDTKEIKLKVTPKPNAMPLVEVIRFVENGADKTSEAQEKAAHRKPPKKDKKDIHLPFLQSEQPRYVFAVVEKDPQIASRVKVSFVPKEPAEDAFKGTAWVDADKGEVLSMGFSLSKNPTFIDHVDVRITFGLGTPLGRAPSEITFDGRGGFLFIRKHLRGRALLSSPRLAY